jgi:hypothetical protein
MNHFTINSDDSWDLLPNIEEMSQESDKPESLKPVSSELLSISLTTQPLLPELNNLLPAKWNYRPGALLAYSIFTIMELTCLAVVYSTTYWFIYCYWGFELKSVSPNFSPSDLPKGNNFQSISAFYRNLCEPDQNSFPECPHLCKTIEPLQNTWTYITGFGLVTVVFIIFSCVLNIIKYKKPTVKISKCVFYLINALPLILYFIGFCIYYSESKFNINFYQTGSGNYAYQPNNFSWECGLCLSIIIMFLMVFTFIARIFL